MNRADARRWRAAGSLAELGELVTAWLRGEVTETPAHAGGPDSETLPLVPVLAALNRAGFVTDNSQLAEAAGGQTWNTWVTGFATDDVLARIRAAAAGTALTVTACRGRDHSERHGWRDGWRCPARETLAFWAEACPGAAGELRRCWHVEVADPEPGRNDLLWGTLAALAGAAGADIPPAAAAAPNRAGEVNPADAQWAAAAWHEAGHAVAQAAQGLPLFDASIWWKTTWRITGRWQKALGAVRPTEEGGYWADDDDVDGTVKTIVAALAGPEAEARWFAAAYGLTLAEARAEVERRERDGDFANVAAYLPLTPLTRAQADQLAAGFVTEREDQIREVAGLLQAKGTLTGAEITAAITPAEPPRPERRTTMADLYQVSTARNRESTRETGPDKTRCSRGPRVYLSDAWKALITATSEFDPEDDSRLLAWMTAEAAGMVGYAEAVDDVHETAATALGLDPAALQALDDCVGAVADAAGAMAAARQRFTAHYAEVRQFAAAGGVLPYDGRWMTSEENHHTPSATGGEGTRREPEAGPMTDAGRLDVERWPIERIGALRSGNNPRITVEEEHQLRMAGQGNPHRNDTMRAQAFGFPDALAYQQHVTDSMRDRGQVNPVEYRDEADYDNGRPDLLVETMTTGHHRYSGARILGWTHMDIKRQGPYGSQDKPVAGFEGR